jgi:hypothetical protein
MLDTLACEIGRRPAGAPSIGAILPAVRSVHRDELQVTVTFDRGATDLVRAVVDAERQCCAGIVWDLEIGEAPVLRMGAAPEQLDVLQAMFAASGPAEPGAAPA